MTDAAHDGAPGAVHSAIAGAEEPPFVEHPWAASFGVLWRAVGLAGSLVAVSLLWVVALGLVVPLPAVTAAILRVALAAVRGRSPSLLPELLAGLREGWWRATIAGALAAAVTVVLVLDLWIAGAMPGPIGTVLQAALVVLGGWWALVNVFLWPLLGGTGMPLRAVLRASLGLSVLELPSAVLAIAAMAGSLLALTVVPASLVLIGPGVVAVVWARVAWRAMGRHLGPDGPDTAA